MTKCNNNCFSTLFFNSCLYLYYYGTLNRLYFVYFQVASGETPFVFQKYLRDTIHHVLQFDGTVLATARLLVVSRLAFLNVSAFWNLFSQENGERTNEAILAFLKVVSDRIDNVVDVAQRKLVALAGLAVLNSFSDLDTVQRAISLVFPVLIQVNFSVLYFFFATRVDLINRVKNSELMILRRFIVLFLSSYFHLCLEHDIILNVFLFLFLLSYYCILIHFYLFLFLAE